MPTATIRGIRTLWSFATGGTSHLSTQTMNPCPWSSLSRWCGASLASRLSVVAVVVGYQMVKKETSEQGVQTPPSPGLGPVFDYRSRTNLKVEVLDFLQVGGLHGQDTMPVSPPEEFGRRVVGSIGSDLAYSTSNENWFG